MAFKNHKSSLTPERIAILNATPGWTWKGQVGGPRNRHLPTKPTDHTGDPIHRERSELEQFHQRFKSMNADTYASTITQDPTVFAAYHAVAERHDNRDPPHLQPINRIATEFLAKVNRPSYTAIDLGCGKNQLRAHPAVANIAWTSVDVARIGDDPTVTIADMSALPYDDESYDIAVLSRSLWARNHDAVLAEVFRILKSGGRAIICESYKRWLAVGGAGDGPATNTLLTALTAAGFTIETKTPDDDPSVFQYIQVRKP